MSTPLSINWPHEFGVLRFFWDVHLAHRSLVGSKVQGAPLYDTYLYVRDFCQFQNLMLNWLAIKFKDNVNFNFDNAHQRSKSVHYGLLAQKF